MVYVFDNSALPGSKPAFVRIPQSGNDSHGMLVAGEYVWACNRGDNTCNVIDSATNRVVNVIDLEASGRLVRSPDLSKNQAAAHRLYQCLHQGLFSKKV